jgi:hypothetical protein
MTRPEIDPEKIAALLDGRLSGQEREALLAQLASSPEHVELFTDASVIAHELGIIAPAADSAPAAQHSSSNGVRPLVATGTVAGAPTLSTARRRWRPAWSAAVGVALLAVVGTWALKRAGVREENVPASGALIAGAGSGIPAGWDGTPWRATRGESAALTPKARAVRIGARLADLELAVQAGDTVARGIVDDVLVLLDGVPLSGSVAQVYEALRDSVGVASGAQAVLVQRGYDGVAELLGRPDVTLGTWTETARIAAARKNSEFFASSRTTQMLRDLSASAPDQQTRGAVGRITALLPVSTSTDWTSLEAATTELLRASAR